MVATLAVAKQWLRSEDVIVSYGDIFYRSGLVQRLIGAEGDIVVAYDTEWLSLWSRRFREPLSDAETFRVGASGLLEEIGQRPEKLDDVKGQYMGLTRWSPRAWEAVERILSRMSSPERDRIDMTGLLQQLVSTGLNISTIPTAGQWGELDQPSDLRLYETMIASGELQLEIPAQHPSAT